MLYRLLLYRLLLYRLLLYRLGRFSTLRLGIGWLRFGITLGRRLNPRPHGDR